ncbi:MAG: CmcJ/NvfI family oxidoreductase, partial [Gammaproteobacteria bacterium]
MATIEHHRLRHVEAVLNYHEDTGERPAHYLYETRPGYTPPPPPNEKHTVAIADARAVAGRFTLDDNGFCCVTSPLPSLDFCDADAVVTGYYPIACDLVRGATGAARVEAFDHNVRDKALAAEPGSGVRTPVRFVHNDYTETSAPQRVRDLMGEEADALLRRRYAF